MAPRTARTVGIAAAGLVAFGFMPGTALADVEEERLSDAAVGSMPAPEPDTSAETLPEEVEVREPAVEIVPPPDLPPDPPPLDPPPEDPPPEQPPPDNPPPDDPPPEPEPPEDDPPPEPPEDEDPEDEDPEDDPPENDPPENEPPEDEGPGDDPPEDEGPGDNPQPPDNDDPPVDDDPAPQDDDEENPIVVEVPDTHVASAGSGDELPVTGAEVPAIIAAGFVLVGFGGAAVYAARRPSEA